MNNISNALFKFTEQIVANAQNDSALFETYIHPDIYEEIKPGKTIRIDDLRSAQPVFIGNNKIRKNNAVVFVHFLKMPETQKLSDRLAARELAEQMADEWLLKIFENEKLADETGTPRVCRIGNIFQFNDWIKPGTVKIPVCVLKVQVNPS